MVSRVPASPGAPAPPPPPATERFLERAGTRGLVFLEDSMTGPAFSAGLPSPPPPRHSPVLQGSSSPAPCFPVSEALPRPVSASWHLVLCSSFLKYFVFSHFLLEFKPLFPVVPCPFLSLFYEFLIPAVSHTFKCCWGASLAVLGFEVCTWGSGFPTHRGEAHVLGSLSTPLCLWPPGWPAPACAPTRAVGGIRAGRRPRHHKGKCEQGIVHTWSIFWWFFVVWMENAKRVC